MQGSFRIVAALVPPAIFAAVVARCSSSTPPTPEGPAASDAGASTPDSTVEAGGSSGDSGNSPQTDSGVPASEDAEAGAAVDASEASTGSQTGNPCSSGADCASGLCVPVGAGDAGVDAGAPTSVCTTACTSSSECIPGWTCGPLPGS